MLPTYKHIFAHVVLVWRSKVKDQNLEQEDVQNVEQELDGCCVEDVVD